MFRQKSIMLASLAALAFSAVIAGSASAGWFVDGAEIQSAVFVSTAAVVDAAPVLLVPTLGLAIQCSGNTFDVKNFELIAMDELSPNDTAKAEALTFLGCNTTKPATGCALAEENQPISVESIRLLATLSVGESVKLLVSVAGGFTGIPFKESNTCAFKSRESLRGEFDATMPTGQLELLVQTLRGSGMLESQGLEIGGDRAAIDGAVLLRVNRGSKWSFK